MTHEDLDALMDTIEERYREIEDWVADLENLSKEQVGNVSRNPIAHLAGLVVSHIETVAYEAASATVDRGTDGVSPDTEESKRRYLDAWNAVWERQVRLWNKPFHRKHPRVQADQGDAS